MPDEDGISLLRRIREKPLPCRDVPAIALSAYASPADTSRALSAGFLRYLPKPIDQATLVRTVLEISVVRGTAPARLARR
jgi:CheY-like chemotaxis protein